MCAAQNSIESARRVAEDLARTEIESAGLLVSTDILSSKHMEAEGCWVFFLNERLHLPDQPGKLIFSAFAVAKKGGTSALVYDFRPNVEQMQSYVEAWSLYALGKREEANAAIESFRKRFPSVTQV